MIERIVEGFYKSQERSMLTWNHLCDLVGGDKKLQEICNTIFPNNNWSTPHTVGNYTVEWVLHPNPTEKGYLKIEKI